MKLYFATSVCALVLTKFFLAAASPIPLSRLVSRSESLNPDINENLSPISPLVARSGREHGAMAPPPGLSTESTYVPKAFLPPNTNPPLMVPKKEYPEALNSLFNIVGLVGTAVTKDLEKKTWDRWVKNFKDRYDFGGMKFPNGGSSHPILAGTKLVERKQMIRDVVRDHNQGKWYKPDNHIEDEIRKVHELGEWDAVKKENTILMAARNAVAPVRQQTFPSPPNDTSIQGVPAILPPHPITDIPARPKSPIKSIGAEEMYHFSGIHPGAAPSPDPKGYCHTANAEIIQTASHNAASLQQESPPGPKSSYTMQGSTAMSPCYPTPIVNDNKRASLPVTSVVPRPHTGTDARQSAGIPASHGGSALHQNDANNHWPGSMPQTPPVTFTDSHIDPFTGISLLHSGSSVLGTGVAPYIQTHPYSVSPVGTLGNLAPGFIPSHLNNDFMGIGPQSDVHNHWDPASGPQLLVPQIGYQFTHEPSSSMGFGPIIFPEGPPNTGFPPLTASSGQASGFHPPASPHLDNGSLTSFYPHHGEGEEEEDQGQRRKRQRYHQ